jgi:hypothetical protein
MTSNARLHAPAAPASPAVTYHLGTPPLANTHRRSAITHDPLHLHLHLHALGCAASALCAQMTLSDARNDPHHLSTALCAQMTLSDASGAHLPLYLECAPNTPSASRRPPEASEHTAGTVPPSSAQPAACTGHRRSAQPAGALHFMVFDAEAGGFLDAGTLGELDYRFAATVDGVPLTLTALLRLMADLLTPLEHLGISWEEAWERVDLCAHVTRLERL